MLQSSIRLSRGSPPATFDSYFERPLIVPKIEEVSTSARQPAPLSSRPDYTKRSSDLGKLRRQFPTSVSRISRFATSNLDTWSQIGSSYIPPALVWSSSLQKDLHAVGEEVTLPPKTVTAIVTAARNGSVSCNPGVLLSQVLQLAPLSELMGRRQMVQLLRMMPSVLNHDPDTLVLNFKCLSPVFGGRQLVAMLVKCPKLLLSSPFTVWSNLAALSELSGLELAQASALLERQPRLLVNSPQALRLRFKMLGQLLGLSKGPLQGLVRKQPALLTYFPEMLESNLESMAEVLGMPAGACCTLVERQPSLLMLGSSTLRDKVKGLRELLGCSPSQLATSVVMRQPSVLTLSTELVSSKLDELGVLLGIRLQEVQVLLLAQPALLTLSVQGLAAKLSSLRSAAGLRPEWQAQLAEASPSTLAAWLCFSAARHQRFQAVASILEVSPTERPLQGLVLSNTVGAAAAATTNGMVATVAATPHGTKKEAATALPSLPKILRMPDGLFEQTYGMQLTASAAMMQADDLEAAACY